MKYNLDDSVLHRIVQIVQEAFLTGIDCADIMRQLELEPAKGGLAFGHEKLVLTENYKEMVKRHHEELLKFAEEQAKKDEGLEPLQPKVLKS